MREPTYERQFDPAHLDVGAFAKAGEHLAGEWPLQALARLSSSADPQSLPRAEDMVLWQLQGELRAVRGDGLQCWLTLVARTSLHMTCQRCLQPMPVSLDLRHEVRFVPGEAAAAQLDAESEEDILALSKSVDAQALIEDELLLALPLVPRHEHCPNPLTPPPDTELFEERPATFAALAGWKPTGAS